MTENRLGGDCDEDSQASGRGPTLKEAFVGRVRGKVLLLLCFMYLITYIDRVNIATAAPFIQNDLGVSNTELGIALCAFSIPTRSSRSSAASSVTSTGPEGARRGRLHVGPGHHSHQFRRWPGDPVRGAARLALGFGEGASFPTATHAMAKWLPPDRRAFGQGSRTRSPG